MWPRIWTRGRRDTIPACFWEELSKYKRNLKELVGKDFVRFKKSVTYRETTSGKPNKLLDLRHSSSYFQDIFPFLEAPKSCKHKLQLFFKPLGNFKDFCEFWYPCLVWFQMTSMISDQNYTTRCSIATLLHPFWNRTILIALIQELLEQQKLPKLPINGLFVFHFPAMWLVSLKNPWNLIGCFFYCLILIGCEKDAI